MTTQQISRENMASKVSNVRSGWSGQEISVTSVTLFVVWKADSRFLAAHALRACEARALHTRGSHVQRFAPSENDCLVVQSQESSNVL